MTIHRCKWCSNDPLYMTYHDHEWGKPVYDEALLFEMLCLEGQQAGLSWITILKKRQNYRQHFFQYSIQQIAQLSNEQLELKLQDAGLIRHLGKLKAIRDNAIAWQKLKQQNINMVDWLWHFSDQPITPNPQEVHLIPTQTEQSLKLSKALKQNGFKFIGATICYAFMQAVGMVNDHEESCSFR